MAEPVETLSTHPIPGPGAVPTLPRDVAAAAITEQRAHESRLAQQRAEAALELGRDGKTLAVRPEVKGSSEFPADTRVFYVNGIATDWNQSAQDAQLLANDTRHEVTMIHASTRGVVADLATCATEKLDAQVAANLSPERSVTKALMDELHGPPGQERLAHDVHFAAHSRGALIMQRGIEEFQRELHARGWSEERISNTLGGHLSVETFGGASSALPAYVKAVHYVRDGDDVAEDFGQGKPTPRSVGTLEGVSTIATATLGPASGLALQASLLKNFTEAPRGPVVAQPPDAFQLNPLTSLTTAHNSEQYLRSRAPFERTYEAWSKTQPREAPGAPHPEARPGQAPSPVRSPDPDRDAIQSRLDELRRGGKHLPDVRAVENFRDRAQSGSFVHVSPEWVAQHCGGGVYQLCNVQRDLNGVRPPEAALVDRSLGGAVRPQGSVEQANGINVVQSPHHLSR